MLSGSNWDCLGELCIDFKKQNDYGKDCYPKTLDACLSMLNHWTPSFAATTPRTLRNPHLNQPPKPEEDEALVFSKILPNILLLCPSLFINHFHSQTTAPLVAWNSHQRSLLMFVARVLRCPRLRLMIFVQMRFTSTPTALLMFSLLTSWARNTILPMIVGAALKNFPMQKRKKSFGSTYATKKEAKKNIKKHNLCHPQNRGFPLSTMVANIHLW